jgi:hypothetical protein
MATDRAAYPPCTAGTPPPNTILHAGSHRGLQGSDLAERNDCRTLASVTCLDRGVRTDTARRVW